LPKGAFGLGFCSALGVCWEGSGLFLGAFLVEEGALG